MTPSADPTLRVDALKKEAKRWLKALRAGDAAATRRLRAALPRHRAAVTLRVVQHALARERGFLGWPALVAASEAKDRELRAVADEILRHGIFRGDPAIAARLFARHPEVATIDMSMAVAAGQLDDVRRRLRADPSSARREGGPLGWAPLLYLTYMRLPGGEGAAVEIASALLDAGADPNVHWRDDWGNAFTPLCGVIGLGEGVKPPHAHAADLADLLLERGANPYDPQAFYNTSIVSDDTRWLDLLWRYAERRGETDRWRTVPEPAIGGTLPVSALDFMLSLAVSYNHERRVEWLIAHGASPGARHAYSRRPLREEALVYGRQAMADLLVRMGASAAPLDPNVAFKVACRKLYRREASRLAAEHPECLADPELLLTAAREGRRDIVELLVDLGTPVDLEDANGMRAIHQATASGALDLVRFLVDRGADVDRPTKHYGGALGFAAHFGRRDVAAFLSRVSRDVHNLVYLAMTDRLRELFAAEPALANRVHPRTGITPLFTLPPEEGAAFEMATFLLAHGADPRYRSPAGGTAADAARKRGFEEIAALLESR